VPGLPAYPQSLIVALFGSSAVRRRIEVWNPMESLLYTIAVYIYYGIYIVKLIVAPLRRAIATLLKVIVEFPVCATLCTYHVVKFSTLTLVPGIQGCYLQA
jgi:hypothetical protein